MRIYIVREVHIGTSYTYSTMDVHKTYEGAAALISAYAEKYHGLPSDLGFEMKYHEAPSDLGFDEFGFTIYEYIGKTSSYGIEIRWEILAHDVRDEFDGEV